MNEEELNKIDKFWEMHPSLKAYRIVLHDGDVCYHYKFIEETQIDKQKLKEAIELLLSQGYDGCTLEELKKELRID